MTNPLLAKLEREMAYGWPSPSPDYEAMRRAMSKINARCGAALDAARAAHVPGAHALTTPAERGE